MFILLSVAISLLTFLITMKKFEKFKSSKFYSHYQKSILLSLQRIEKTYTQILTDEIKCQNVKLNNTI